MAEPLKKAPTGIEGLDELTGGGLPVGRPSLICGGPGCGKTLLAVTFLAQGSLNYGEPGVILSFDEPIRDLATNALPLGIDLDNLQQRKLVATDHVYLDRQAFQETGEYDLEGLFVRLDAAVRSVNARRVVLDSIDTLFAGIPNQAIVRSELRRLFEWLKERQLTTIITAERGERSLTRHGIEEYVSDCVILLDHRVIDELSTRRLRVIKYRGSVHGTNEYPFLIDETGISVLPVTSLTLKHKVYGERAPTGILDLDAMLEGSGYYKGSSILVIGGPGAGKTSIGAHAVDEACRRGERCLFISFEESPAQLVRNMQSIGLDLQSWVDQGLLKCFATRPSLGGLEMHLVLIMKFVSDFKPSFVVIDPLSALIASGKGSQSSTMFVRLIDYLKGRGITSIFMQLEHTAETAMHITTLMDTVISVTNIHADNALSRRLYIIKSRGMAHSSGVRRMEITKQGLKLGDLPVSTGGAPASAAR